MAIVDAASNGGYNEADKKIVIIAEF